MPRFTRHPHSKNRHPRAVAGNAVPSSAASRSAAGGQVRTLTAQEVREGHAQHKDHAGSDAARGAHGAGRPESGSHRASDTQHPSGGASDATRRRTAGRPASGAHGGTDAGGRRHGTRHGEANEGGSDKPATSTRPKSRYIPALDGLRTFAVLAVIAYHMGMPWATGGLLGVTVFFVLSGYLITSLLVIEFQGTGRINLPDFWLRRVRRLFPAIVFSIAGIAVLCTVFNHALLTKLRPDVLPSLFFFNNWWQIFHNVSYFDALGSPSPVTHFWSLAIEEQFYLIWPVLLLILMKLGVKKRTLSIVTLVLAAASALEMGILFDPHGDPSRVYYGTDTRAFSLLIGAWLALVWPSNQLGATDSVNIDKHTRWILDGVGIAAFVGLFLMVGLTDGFSPFLYYGGLVLCSVLTAIVIAVMVHPASILGKFWALPPLVWIGKRSYGIYLWHYPLILLMMPANGLTQTPWWMMLLTLAAIIAISAFSYTFVENPIRHGAIGTLLSDIANHRTAFAEWVREHVVPVVAGSLVVLIAIGGLIFVPDTSSLEGGDLLKDESAQVGGPTAQAFSQPAAPGADKPKLDILMIGDSVSVRAIPNFQSTFPYGAIDAAVNRQLYVGQDIYDTYAAQDIVGDAVVFALGTNGVATDEQLDSIVNAVGADRHIWFINTRSTTSWMAETNAALQRAADRYGNVDLIDWYSLSAQHGEWFDGDGTHLSQNGAQAYIDMVYNAVKDYLPQHSEGDEHAELKSTPQYAADTVKEDLADLPAKVFAPLKTPIPMER